MGGGDADNGEGGVGVMGESVTAWGGGAHVCAKLWWFIRGGGERSPMWGCEGGGGGLRSGCHSDGAMETAALPWRRSDGALHCG